MPCHGNAETHCCWLGGVTCVYLEEHTVEGRHWACGLRRKYGNWDDVLKSEEYLRDIDPHFSKKGINCKDWPDFPEGTRCFDCGFGM